MVVVVVPKATSAVSQDGTTFANFHKQESKIDDNHRFLDASSHLYKRVCPSVRPSVPPYVMLLWKMPNIAIFMYRNDQEGIKSHE